MENSEALDRIFATILGFCTLCFFIGPRVSVCVKKAINELVRKNVNASYSQEKLAEEEITRCRKKIELIDIVIIVVPLLIAIIFYAISLTSGLENKMEEAVNEKQAAIFSLILCLIFLFFESWMAIFKCNKLLSPRIQSRSV